MKSEESHPTETGKIGKKKKFFSCFTEIYIYCMYIICFDELHSRLTGLIKSVKVKIGLMISGFSFGSVATDAYEGILGPH